TAAGSATALSAHESVLKLQQTSRGSGIPFGAAERVWTTSDGCAKGSLPECHRFVARAARFRRAAVAPDRLRQRDHRHTGSSETTFRGQDFRRELDCRHCTRPATQPLSSEKGSARGTDLVFGKS